MITTDGVALNVGDRVLVKDQTNGEENGIYIADTGAWTRSADADNTPSGEVTSGMYTYVEEGTVNGGITWVLITQNPITLGVTPLVFSQHTGASSFVSGDGLLQSGNVVNVVGTAGRIDVNADNIDLATTGVTPGTYTSMTVDAYGRVQAATNPTTVSGYGITDGFTVDDSGTWRKMEDKNGAGTEWIQTTTNGILPSSDGVGSIGHTSWRFSQGWFDQVYSEGVRVPKITVSTANPSGGQDGDVWFKVV